MRAPKFSQFSLSTTSSPDWCPLLCPVSASASRAAFFLVHVLGGNESLFSSLSYSKVPTGRSSGLHTVCVPLGVGCDRLPGAGGGMGLGAEEVENTLRARGSPTSVSFKVMSGCDPGPSLHTLAPIASFPVCFLLIFIKEL